MHDAVMADELPETDAVFDFLPIAHDGVVCRECAAVAGVMLPVAGD